MIMNEKEITARITEMKEYERMREELDTMIESIKDEIKGVMGADELLVAGPYKVTWKSVTSSRLDADAIRKAFPAVNFAPYMKSSTSRRFLVN